MQNRKIHLKSLALVECMYDQGSTDSTLIESNQNPEDPENLNEGAGRRIGLSFAKPGAPRRAVRQKGTGADRAKWRRTARKNKAKRRRQAKLRDKKPQSRRRKERRQKHYRNEAKSPLLARIADHLNESSSDDSVVENQYVLALENCAEVAIGLSAFVVESEHRFVFEEMAESCYQIIEDIEGGLLDESAAISMARRATDIMADAYGLFEDCTCDKDEDEDDEDDD